MSGDAHPEIVIIRRGGHGDHDDHHGGVWKIAFADFMTAMMAFFLVMWLISANDKTRSTVARYFNPVRLVDATAKPPHGLLESKKEDSGVATSPEADEKKKGENADKPAGELKPTADAKAKLPETPAGREKRLDSELQVNPFAALSEIVAEKGPGQLSSQSAPAPREPSVGLNGGAHFRDPFAPPPPQQQLTKTASLSDKSLDSDLTDKDDDTPPDSKPVPKSADDETPVAAQKQAAELEAAVKASAKATGGERGPHVDVTSTKEGLLLSLTDTSDFSMFSNGSAVPSRKVVVMMEKIGQLLKTRPGTIVLRGYTDNKPFKSGRYDNWHLSIDRAQVAHYMLVRGGLADVRVAHIEGFADRGGRPGVGADSPLNRRIEILLKDEPA